MAKAEPVGNLIDSLDVKHHPEEGELVSGAMVLLRVVSPEGGVYVRLAYSDGLSWLDRLGMIRAVEIHNEMDVRSANVHPD